MIHVNDKAVALDERSKLSPYVGQDWAKTYWQEWAESVGREYQPFVMWARKEYYGKYINIDSKGMRKCWNPDSSEQRKPKTLYIFGGSTIWGPGARDDYTIPSYVSRILNGKGYDFTVYNYGGSGYMSMQEIIHLLLLLKEGCRPDYVIFYDGFNDIYAAYQNGEAGTTQNLLLYRQKLQMAEPSPLEHIVIGIKGVFTQYCVTYRVINNLVEDIKMRLSPQQQFTEAASGYPDEKLKALGQDILKDYLSSVTLVDKLSLTYGFKYLCLWQPSAYTDKMLTPEEKQAASPRINDKALGSLYTNLNDELMPKSIPHFFNISDVLDTRLKTIYIDDAHLSEEGNALVAARIVSLLESEYLAHQ